MFDYLQRHLDTLGTLTVAYAPRVLLALITLFIGLNFIKVVVKVLRKQMERRDVDVTLRPFLTSLLNWTLKIVLFISVASMVGIETTSFVAILGTVSLAVGLALQGTLANFAGGVLVMIFKPYRVGDLVEVQGYLGHVLEIQIFTTTLATLENKKVILPNGSVSNGNIVNYTALGKIRVDLLMGVAYSADLKKARTAIMEVMQNHDKVLKEPAPFVGVLELADSSVNLAVRPWCKPEHYWDVYFEVLENGKIALDNNNVEIPFPQVDVHMKS